MSKAKSADARKVRFHVNMESLDIGTIMDLEDVGELAKSGQPATRRLVTALLPFVVDDAGNRLPDDEAFAYCRLLTVGELQRVFEGVAAAIQSGAVSPPTASDS